MATAPRAEHWPKRDERHAAYLSVIPLTDPAVFIAHCTANDFFSQTQSSDRHTSCPATTSFPSGHAPARLRYEPRSRCWCCRAGGAGCGGSSRTGRGGPETVLLAVHCPSDVIAGLAEAAPGRQR